MKIVSVEATKVNYPRLKPMTVPRSGPSRSDLNAQATPLRRYTKDPDFGFSRKVPGGDRDVGCVVTLEDGTWGFGFTDHGRTTASLIEDYLAPAIEGQRCLFHRDALRLDDPSHVWFRDERFGGVCDRCR